MSTVSTSTVCTSTALLIVGASVRSAAQAAARAGFEVTGIDQFNDRDLRGCAAVMRVRDFPNEIPRLARRVPRCHWMYTGGMENAPELVEAISRWHPLWGTGPAALRQVRDPWQLGHVLRRAGLLFPELRSEAPQQGCGQWLR